RVQDALGTCSPKAPDPAQRAKQRDLASRRFLDGAVDPDLTRADAYAVDLVGLVHWNELLERGHVWACHARNPGARSGSVLVRPRWFELARLKPDTPPRLATWAARTCDIRSTLAASSEPLGKVEPMSRDRLSWLITIPPDGRLPLGGVAPALIEWRTEPHPATRMQDAGCSLIRLEAFHPEAPRISALLRSLSAEGAISVAP